MCLVSHYLPGVLADEEAQQAGAALNADSHGYAIWIGPGEFRISTGTDAAALIKEFASIRAVYPHGHAVFHSRWITAGAPGLDNAQPFLVPIDDREGVFAHNGTFKDEVPGKGQEGWSDSRVLAARIFPHLRLTWQTALHDEMLISGSRGLVITPSGEGIRFGDWSVGAEHNGVWHSNYDFVPPPRFAGSVRNAKEQLHLHVRTLARKFHHGDAEAGQQLSWLLHAFPELGTGVCE